MSRLSEDAKGGLGCLLILIIVIGIPVGLCGFNTNADGIYDYKVSEFTVCDNVVFLNGDGYPNAGFHKSQLAFDWEPKKPGFTLQVKYNRWWDQESTLCVRKHEPISKVLLHEPGWYTVLIPNGTALDTLEIHGATLEQDAPADGPMYIETIAGSDSYNTPLRLVIHIHDPDEIQGGGWRVHRHKARDRTGQTNVVE